MTATPNQIVITVKGKMYSIVRYEHNNFNECSGYCPYLIKLDPIYNTPICTLFKEPLTFINSKENRVTQSSTCKQHEKSEHEKERPRVIKEVPFLHPLFIKDFNDFTLSKLL